MLPDILRNYAFVQNGPVRSTHLMSGQGQLTIVNLANGLVSEHIVPRPHDALQIADLSRGPKWRRLLALFVGLFARQSGTANTAVQLRDGRLFAVEEASRPYEITYNATTGEIGGKWQYRGELSGVHVSPGDTLSYDLLRRQAPLKFNGKRVRWQPKTFPVVVHSYAEFNSWKAFPLMSTHVGNFEDWICGNRALPISHQEPLRWLMHNIDDERAVIVDTGLCGDVFHVLAGHSESDDFNLYACHVDHFESFLETQDASALGFQLCRHVIDARTMQLRSVDPVHGVQGDFPRVVDKDVFMLHNIAARELVFFNHLVGCVVHRTPVARRNAMDIVYAHGFLLYCTRKSFVVQDLEGNVVHEAAIPERHTNMHAELVSLDYFV